MKKKICQYLSDVLVEMPEEELLKLVEIPPEEKMGDLALPCFAMAKKMHKNPMQIASELVEKLNEQKEFLGIEKAENAGGTGSAESHAKGFSGGFLGDSGLGWKSYPRVVVRVGSGACACIAAYQGYG